MSVRVLDSSVANLIAAGEVVERPAAVVKELVENSIDAGARHISLEIEEGGKKLIRVTDDGYGMSADDCRLSLQKHATSKIYDKDDLFCIKTLGFRGEAVPSIAAVSKYSVLTKRAESDIGFKMTVDGGVILSEDEASSADGTTVTVSDLFYNTPARLKFLKSDGAETGAIRDYVAKLAVSRPDISFSLAVNGQEALFTPGNGNEDDAVFAVFGKEFLQQLLKTDVTTRGIRVHGYTCKPVFSKPNRRDQLFYVNGRYVRSKMLQTVLENSYRNSLMISRYPYAVLFVELNAEDMDINVHPSKLEVKFADEQGVADAVSAAVRAALSFENGVQQIRIPQKEPVPSVKPVPTPVVLHTPVPVIASAPVTADIKKEEHKPSIVTKTTFDEWTVSSPVKTEIPVAPIQTVKKDVSEKFCEPSKAPDSLRSLSNIFDGGTALSVHDSVAPLKEEKTEQFTVVPVEEETTIDDFVILGEAYSAYIIVQKEEEILFIDKHALHERMNFERLKTEKIATQMLLSPVILDFGKEDNALLLENKDLFAESGFVVDDFGTSVAVREIPMLLKVYHVEKIFAEFVELLKAGSKQFEPLDEILHSVACKASIKSGSETSDVETKNLIARYFRDKDKLKYCPHGRPIAFSLSRNALEKEFKRIV